MAAAASMEDRPEVERITDQLKELDEAWARLQDEMAKRRERLNASNLAQQYYNDADEAEAWIGEQELYMIADEKAKVRGCGSACRNTLRVYFSPAFSSLYPQDEQSAMLMLKRHMILKQAVEDYADSIQKLADRAQKMFAEDHPDGSVLWSFDEHIKPACSRPQPSLLSAVRRSSGDRARWTSSTRV